MPEDGYAYRTDNLRHVRKVMTRGRMVSGFVCLLPKTTANTKKSVELFAPRLDNTQFNLSTQSVQVIWSIAIVQGPRITAVITGLARTRVRMAPVPDCT